MKLNLQWHHSVKLGKFPYSSGITKIPASAGIYVFLRVHGSSAEALYVGKATNLKSRIKQQMNNLKLMTGIQKAANGERRLVFAEFISRSGQQVAKAMPLCEKALIVSSFIVAIVMCVFAGSAMALDFDQEWQRQEQQRQEQQRQNTASVGISTEGFCDKVQSMEVYKRYAKLTGDAIRSNTYGYTRLLSDPSNYGSEIALFDSPDGLLRKWVSQKRGSEQSISIGTFMVGLSQNEVQTVVQCVEKLLPTDFAYVFIPHNTVNKLREYKTSSKTVREVNDKGEIIEKTIASGSTLNGEILSSLYGQSARVPHFMALILGGEKLLNTTGTEYVNRYESALKEYQKNLLAQSEAKANQKQEDAQKIAQIKKGDYSQVKSCSEISEALQIPNYLFEVFVTPPMKQYSGFNMLAKHSDSVLGGSEEILGDNGHYYQLKIPNKALKINATNSKIGGLVSYIGIYSANSTATLVSGASVQVPVFDVSCVEY